MYNPPPYSENKSNDEIIQTAHELLKLFNRNSEIKLIECNTIDALRLEKKFRHDYWLNQDDDLRLEMHFASLVIYDKIEQQPEYKEKWSEAWREAQKCTYSEVWTNHFHHLLNTVNNLDNSYLRIFFRLAQQAFNRQQRWKAVFHATESSAYSYIYKLSVYGVLFLGFHKNTLYLQKISQANFPDIVPGHYPLYGKHNKIFICHEFGIDKDADDLKQILADKNYHLEYGPVNERTAPIEHQIGESIATSSLMIAVVKEIHELYGLSIWLAQEIDLAQQLGIPIIALSCSEQHTDELQDTWVIKYEHGSIGFKKTELLQKIEQLLN